MKKILSIIIFFMVALTAMAQNIAADKRVVITDAEGNVHAFATNSLARLSFDNVGDVSVALSGISKTSYSITVSLAKPDACSRYQFAIWPASLSVADTVAYIQANYKKELTVSSQQELTSLNGSTKYIVAALAYDKYDIASDVTTIAVTTSPAEQLAAPKVGDILYSDGTWSTKLNKKKSAIGIVFNIGTSKTDSINGWKNGYAMALKNSGERKAWATQEGNLQSGRKDYVSADTSLTHPGYMSDLDGYTETHALLANVSASFPAAESATSYPVTVPMTSSGWYLPSVGQWIRILVNLGGLSATPHRYSASNAFWDYCSRTFISTINTKLANVSEDADKFESDDIYYWTSTEYGSATAYEMHINYEEDGIDVDSYMKTYGFPSCRVRPVIAF